MAETIFTGENAEKLAAKNCASARGLRLTASWQQELQKPMPGKRWPQTQPPTHGACASEPDDGDETYGVGEIAEYFEPPPVPISARKLATPSPSIPMVIPPATPAMASLLPRESFFESYRDGYNVCDTGLKGRKGDLSATLPSINLKRALEPNA